MFKCLLEIVFYSWSHKWDHVLFIIFFGFLVRGDVSVDEWRGLHFSCFKKLFIFYIWSSCFTVTTSNGFLSVIRNGLANSKVLMVNVILDVLFYACTDIEVVLKRISFIIAIHCSLCHKEEEFVYLLLSYLLILSIWHFLISLVRVKLGSTLFCNRRAVFLEKKHDKRLVYCNLENG